MSFLAPTLLLAAFPSFPSDPDGVDVPVIEGRGAQHSPSIALDPRDAAHFVVVAARPDATPIVEWATTFDAGAQVVRGTFLPATGFQQFSLAHAAFLSDGTVVVVGTMYFGPGGNAVVSFRSLDGGLTWDGGTVIDLAEGNDGSQLDVRRSPGASGHEIAAVWTNYFTNEVLVSTSADGGLTWTTPLGVGDNPAAQLPVGADVAYGPNDVLAVSFRDRATQQVLVDVSLDGGQTFGSDRVAATCEPVAGNLGFRTLDWAALAVDPRPGALAGNLYVSYQTWRPGRHQSEVHCAVSSDGGSTWTDQRVHERLDTGSTFFPAIAVDHGGVVLVAHQELRPSGFAWAISTHVSRSADGGRRWERLEISDRSWSPGDVEHFEDLGSFLGIASEGGATVATWEEAPQRTLDVVVDSLSLELFSDVDQLSAAQGGKVPFHLGLGPKLAGATYLLLGSASGTEPGLDFGPGVHLPLNYDAFTQLTLLEANGPVLPRFHGVLDANGRAEPELDTSGPFSPALAGLTLHFAALAVFADPVAASGATAVVLTN